MPNTESLVFDLLVRDRASGGLGDIGKAADGASRNTDALTKRLNELSRKSVEARLKLAGDKEALASLDKMDARLISLDRRVASPNMKVEGAARAIAEISAVDLELDKLGGQGGTADIATASLGAGGLSGPGGMGALIGAGVALSPVIATVAVGLGGLAVGAYGTISPILKASQATGGLAANMATLNPQQQQMGRQLLALEGQAGGFAKSLQPQVVKIWGDALSIAGGVLHDVEPVAKGAGDGLHQVMQALNMNFNSAEWQNFFTWMGVNAAPDVKLLGQNLIDLVNTLPGLLTTLQPVATSLLTVLDGVLKVVHGLEVVKTLTSHAGDPTALLAAMNAMNGTAGAATAVGAAAAAAAPKVGTLSADVAILGTTTSNSTLALQAYSDLWNLFVGNTVGDQQAVLNVTQAFESFDKTVATSGATSTAAQQAFLSIFTTIGTGLDALHKNGASVSQLNSFYQTSINRLSALHGLTPIQRQDVTGLTKDYLAWANSVTGLSGNVVKASHNIRDDFLVTMSATHRLVPSARKDADDFADAVLKTGTNSRATKRDRDVLVADLVRSGLSALDAKARVKGFQDRIDALHGKTVPIDATASGSGGISVTAPGLAARIFKLSHLATGARIPGFGGGDVHPALLEGGETVVDKYTSRRLAPVFKAAGVPGYAAGGIAGMPPFLAGQEGGVVGGWAGSSLQSMVNAMIAAYKKTLGFLGAGSGNYAADIQAVLGAMGLPLSLTGNWLSQIQTESGGNLNAVNLTDSNARAGHPSVGLLQLIPGTFHAYAGPYVNTPPLVNFGGGTVSENAMAQIYAGIHYAAARYGGAAMASVIGHGHGYDQGGYLPTGLSLAYNGTGKPEPVGPAAGTTYVINVYASPLAGPADTGRAVVGAIQAFEKRSGKGWRS